MVVYMLQLKNYFIEFVKSFIVDKKLCNGNLLADNLSML